MARTILLETKTANFLELLGNGKIYRVPPYQRDYSWSEEHWEDLWNDIIEMRGKPQERHYMGALVIEGRSDREFLIIDGQQRLATLSALALAVLRQLLALAERDIEPDQNRQRATALRHRFIGEKDPASLLESSKLFLNESDDPFFQDYLVQLREPINPRGLIKSNKLLWECHTYFLRRLGEVADLAGDGEQLAMLLNETVARQLLFIQISVEDEINAYTVFETLNARGLELSSTDLLKNYLFSKIKVKSDLDALQRRWRHLITTVRQERFPDFLRYHLLCTYRQVRKQRLFKMVRDTVRDPAAVFALVKELEQRAELFAALQDPSHEYWNEWSGCKPYVRELKLFNVRQMMPLLFAAWERLDKSDFARVLKLVSVISFRYTMVSGLNTNELEPIYHKAAKGVLDGELTTPAQIFAVLKPIYVADERFEHDFALLELSASSVRKRLVRYILLRLEADRSERSLDAETDSGSIEHILPENPGPDWDEAIPAEHWASAVYRLGNLTLLEASSNRRIGNEAYATKQAVYATSQYLITRSVVELAPESWTLDHLNRRQQEMARRAVHLWRADFV